MLCILKSLPGESAGKSALPCCKYDVEFPSDTENFFDEIILTVTIKIMNEKTILINITSFCERKIDKYLCERLLWYYKNL